MPLAGVSRIRIPIKSTGITFKAHLGGVSGNGKTLSFSEVDVTDFRSECHNFMGSLRFKEPMFPPVLKLALSTACSIALLGSRVHYLLEVVFFRSECHKFQKSMSQLLGGRLASRNNPTTSQANALYYFLHRFTSSRTIAFCFPP